MSCEPADAWHPHQAVPSFLRVGQTGGYRSRRWDVVQTQSHAEARAIFHLEQQGYRVFCPRIRKTVRHARKVTHVLAPLFPGYIFLDLDISSEPWRAVNGTRGVSRLIAFGENPQPVPVGIVEALRRRAGDDCAVTLPTLKVGQSVRIIDGPFTDFLGTLRHLDASGRVQVLLDLLGRSVSVALRCDALTAA